MVVSNYRGSNFLQRKASKAIFLAIFTTTANLGGLLVIASHCFLTQICSSSGAMWVEHERKDRNEGAVQGKIAMEVRCKDPKIRSQKRCGDKKDRNRDAERRRE